MKNTIPPVRAAISRVDSDGCDDMPVRKEDPKQMKRSKNRYSISVSGATYDRLRSVTPRGRLAGFVDGVVASALDDPKILERLTDSCQYEQDPPPPLCPRSR